MTYPPNDDPFPGTPGGHPFPGQPGQPPGPRPPQNPYGHQEPPPGQPFPGPQGPPPGPQSWPGAPGGGPPQQPPPRQGRPGGSRRGLIIGGVAVALLLMVSLGVVVWNALDGRPYADLPSCRQLLSAEVMETIPGTTSPHADGEYQEMDEDTAAYLDESVRGYLNCSVEDDEHIPLLVGASLYEHEDEGEAVDGLREDMEDALRDLEEGRYGEYGMEEVEVLDWRPLSVGDEGYAVVFEERDHGGGLYGSFSVSTVNVSLTASYSSEEGDLDETELLDFLGDLADRMERQLSREAEKV